MKNLSLLFLLIIFNSIIYPAGSDDIRERIRSEIDKLPASTETGLLIFNPLTEDTIISINHTRSMIPASNTKLFTTAAALNIMGPDYVLSTKILQDSVAVTDSTINGNLYIKGFGNSLFTSHDLDSLVTVIINSGIRKINGDIVGDDTFFDNVYTRDDWIKGEHANVKLPPVSALVLDRNTTFVRRKRRGRWRTYRQYIQNPPLYAAEQLTGKLKDAGVSITGKSVSGAAPGNAVVLAESKIILSELIKTVNKNSDNFLAECLFKTIGAVASGEQGNSFYSTQAILTFIEDNAIYSEGTAVVDGSGISRNDQITAGSIVGLLEKVYFDLKIFPFFYNSLSIAGVDGTLEDRMFNKKEPVNFRGKTGTLNGVSSLSGYLTTKNGDDLIVSIIFEFNKGGANKYRDVQDRIINILNEWNEESPEESDLQGF